MECSQTAVSSSLWFPSGLIVKSHTEDFVGFLSATAAILFSESSLSWDFHLYKCFFYHISKSCGVILSPVMLFTLVCYGTTNFCSCGWFMLVGGTSYIVCTGAGRFWDSGILSFLCSSSRGRNAFWQLVLLSPHPVAHFYFSFGLDSSDLSSFVFFMLQCFESTEMVLVLFPSFKDWNSHSSSARSMPKKVFCSVHVNMGRFC